MDSQALQWLMGVCCHWLPLGVEGERSLLLGERGGGACEGPRQQARVPIF